MTPQLNSDSFVRRLKRHVNSLPLELAIQHYYPLASNFQQSNIRLTETEDWDLVRKTEGHFFIPEDRDHWLEMCNGPIEHDSNSGDLPARAASVVQFISERGLRQQLFSLGVGLAALEYHIKGSGANIKVFCSDFSQETVRRLRKNFLECDGIRSFDLISERFKETFPEATSDSVVLLHRIDPCLTDQQWKGAFSNFAADGVRNLLLVPHRVLDLRYLVFSKRREIVSRISRRPLALSGAVRTYKRWLQLWSDHYDLNETVKIGYSQGFWLVPRSANLMASRQPPV